MYQDLKRHPQITVVPSFVLALFGLLCVPMFGCALSCMLLPLFSAISVLLGLFGIHASLEERSKVFLTLSVLGTVGAIICFGIFFSAWDYQMHLEPAE